MDIREIVRMAVEQLSKRLDIDPSLITPSDLEKDATDWRVYLYVSSGGVKTKYLAIADPVNGLISRIEKSEDLLIKPPGERSENDLNRVKRTFTPKQLDVLKEDYIRETKLYESILQNQDESQQEKINAYYVLGKVYREMGVIFGSPLYLQKALSNFKEILNFPDSIIAQIKGKVLNYMGLTSFKIGEIMFNHEEMQTAIEYFKDSTNFFKYHSMMAEYNAVQENLEMAAKKLYGKEYKKALTQIVKAKAK
jgi:tetratricopeptide (TPR) repeat protein